MAAFIFSDMLFSIWLSTVSGMVQTHQSALACVTTPVPVSA